jgi:hypothetical protein
MYAEDSGVGKSKQCSNGATTRKCPSSGSISGFGGKLPGSENRALDALII